MNPPEDSLTMAEHHVREGERRVARQIVIIEEMNRDNHPEAAARARMLLVTLQKHPRPNVGARPHRAEGGRPLFLNGGPSRTTVINVDLVNTRSKHNRRSRIDLAAPMTEAEARRLLRDCEGLGGLEAWIAWQRWQAVPGGWRVIPELQGWRFRLEVVPEGLRVTDGEPEAGGPAWVVGTL